MITAKLTFKDATPTMLQKAAKEAVGIRLTVKAEDLKALADPLALVEACNVKGGPAPVEVKKALDVWKKEWFSTKTNIIQLDKKLEEAKNNLENAVKSYFPVNSRENVKLKNKEL